MVLVFVTAQAGAPAEREFLGRKIFSVPLPAMPFAAGSGAPNPNRPRTLHYTASGGYVAFSTDNAILEEFLRRRFREKVEVGLAFHFLRIIHA